MKQTLLIGNSKIEVYFEINRENIKKNLVKTYDVINDIALNCKKRGIDISNCFYSKEDIEKLKKNNNYNFL